MTLNYGLRFSRALVIGFLMASSYLWIALNPLPLSGQWFALALPILTISNALALSRSRRLRVHILIVSMAVALAAVIEGLMSGTGVLRRFIDMNQTLTATHQPISVPILVPIALALMPPLLVFVRAVVLEHPRFRRWFAFEHGGSARWAGPASVRQRHFPVFRSKPSDERGYLDG